MELITFIEQTLDECKRRLYRTLQGLTPAELTWSPGPEANSITFMVWHVARVEDRWLHRFAQDTTEVWQREGWAQRLGLPEHGTGVGYSAAQVASFPNPDMPAILAYFDAVRQATLTY
ncbi:MAG: DinB family protein, partial [Candidatus Tectomicrobia bacterium]|nr:DinB family protein [Candidatus Tectomicrobia bacterium]